MPNQYTKHTRPTRPHVAHVRMLGIEAQGLADESERRQMTVSDVIRERCGFQREDGLPNEPWDNRLRATGEP